MDFFTRSESPPSWLVVWVNQYVDRRSSPGESFDPHRSDTGGTVTDTGRILFVSCSRRGLILSTGWGRGRRGRGVDVSLLTRDQSRCRPVVWRDTLNGWVSSSTVHSVQLKNSVYRENRETWNTTDRLPLDPHETPHSWMTRLLDGRCRERPSGPTTEWMRVERVQD